MRGLSETPFIFTENQKRDLPPIPNAVLCIERKTQCNPPSSEDRFNCSEAKQTMISILAQVILNPLLSRCIHINLLCLQAHAEIIGFVWWILLQERLLGAALGSVFAGAVIFEQRRDIYKTIAQNQPAKSQVISHGFSSELFQFLVFMFVNCDSA